MNGITRKLLALCMTVLMLASMAVPAFASEPEHTHSHQAAVTTAATCTAEGVMTYTCACGDTYTAAIPMAEHIYGEAVVTPASCTAEGSNAYTCTVCDFVNTQTVPATGHSYGEPVVTAASCTADGSRVYTCTVEGCGYVYTEFIPATGHSYGEPVVTAASCTTDGSRVYTCTVEGCGNVYTEVIPAAHTYGEPVVTPSACTTDGSRVYTCTVEGCGYVHTELIPAAHTYGEPVVADAACTVEGSRTYTCTVEGCGYVHTELIPATGHSYVDMVCSACGTVQCCWQPDCLAAEHEEGCLKGSVDKVTALMAQLPLADTVTEENFEAVKALMDEIRAVDDAHRQAWLHTEYEMYVWNILQADANYVELYDIIANGVMMLEVADPAAKIGENEFATLAEAIAYANINGGTVTVMKDVILTGPLTVTGSMVLDLNGKTISQTQVQTGNYQMILNDGALAIQDSVGTGKISYTDSGSGGNYVSNTITNRGTLTLYSGTIENLSSETVGINGYPYVIDSSIWGSAAAVNTNIAGGRLYSAGYSAIRLRADSSKPVNVTVTAGEIIGTIEVQNSSTGDNVGNLSITGGSISNYATSNAIFIFGNNSSNLDVSITGGNFAGKVVLKNTIKNSKFISGGTFNSDVSTLLADGYTLQDNGNGTYSPVPPSPVAQVGETKYNSLQEAINNANGGTVTLLKDVSLSETLRVNAGVSVTLELNGKTINGVDQVNIALMSYGNLTVKDSSEAKTGAIRAGKNDGKSGNTVNICAGTFTLESGNIYSVNNAILIDEQAANVTIKGGNITADPATNNSAAFYISSTAATVVNIEGGSMLGFNGILLWDNTTINISGGSIEGRGRIGIQGNGSKDNTLINISGNASVSGAETAIYHPQGGTLNISGNAALTGATGVVVKGGTVNISGGSISATGSQAAYTPVNSGFSGTGDALYIEHYDNSPNSENYGTPVVNITGGSFSSANGAAVASYANPNTGVTALNKFISGGTFSSDVSALLADGYVLKTNENGTYSAALPSPVAEVGENQYTSLQEAINNANGGTVTLLEDIELTEGVTVPAGATVTLELNGKTISRNTEAASSSAAITNNGTLTVKDSVGNGKITAFAQNPDTAAIPYYASNTITNNGVFTLLSGTIENSTDDAARAAFPIDNNSTSRDAITNIQGGTVIGRGAIRQFANSTTNRNEVSITGGTVSGTSYGVWVQNPSDGSTTNASDTKAKLSISGGSVSKVLLEPSAALEVSITGGSISEVALWEEETVNTSRNPSGFISGGSFIREDSVEADMLKPGYTLVANESGGFSPALTDPEAMIGETPYATLAEAVAEANASGGTVKVMKDVALTGPLTVTGSMVLDLNGNTVSYSSDIPGDAMLTNNGALTVQDSSAEGDGKFVYTYTGAADTSYGKGNYTIVNNGTLNVSSGTVENATAAMSHAYYAVQNFAGATLNVYGGNIINKTGHAVRMASFGAGANNVNVSGGYIEGTRAIMVQLPGSDSSSAPEYNLNISGGTLASNETTYNLGVYIFSNGQSAANVKLGISGGTINGNVAINAAATGTMAKDSARVTGGTINGEYGIFSYSDDDDTAAAVISITGGNFKNKNSEYYCYHDEGYAFVQNSDGSYSPMSINEAKIGDTPYTTFAEALEAAPEDSTIVLMRSVVYPDDLVISKNITIDPNGFSFGLAVGKLIKVDEGKVLTIDLDYATYGEAFKALAPGLCVSEGSIKIQHHAVGTNGSAATCTSGPVCGYCGETFGAALGHSLVYTGSGSTITESCARSCGHSATAKLELDSSVSTAYTGSEIKPIKVVYSDKWIAAKDLTVTYKDNIAIGTDTATGTIQKANENSSEVATATLKFSITRASYTLTVNNYRYVRASGYPLSFTSNVPYDASNTVSKLLIVRANGTPVMEVPAAHFVLSANSSGMTVITLSPTVMNALDALNYELQATFTNGDAKGAFRVLLPFIFPMTGDDAQTLLLLCLTFIALGTAAVTIFVIRKKSKGSRYNSKR